MKRGTLSVSMDAALNAWALRDKVADSTGAQIAMHAVAHGVSASGLYRALIAAGLLQKKATQGLEPGA